MTTNENPGSGSGTPGGPGGWQPVPQGGEYDGESTAFVHLPPEDALDAPLAAPGHGYVPPSIDPLTQRDPAAGDPSVPGGWAAQPVAGADGTQWPEPQQSAVGHDGSGYGQGGYGHGGYGPGGYAPQGTSHWNFSDIVPEAAAATGEGTAAEGVAGSEPSGQWTIPVAQGDLPDESGEFSTSMLTSSWESGPPAATLPGGATAPWVPEETAPAPGEPGGPQEATAEPLEPAAVHESTAVTHEPAEVHETAAVHELAVHDDAAPEDPAGAAPGSDPAGAAPGSDPLPEPEPAAEPAAFAEPAPFAEPTPFAEPAPLTSSNDSAEHPAGSYVLRVNGADRPVTDAWIGESLLYVLRERLGLAGAKDGCSQGECGACNVQVDGRLVASCLVPAATAAGSEVRTVEGLAADGEPSDVQRALARCGAVQCGFCVPGMAMTVHDLLEGNHAPSELETRQALCGNLCRCSGYRGVLDAVDEVVAERRASAEAAAAASEEARVPHQAPPGNGGAHPRPAPGRGRQHLPNQQHSPNQQHTPHSPDGGMA